MTTAADDRRRVFRRLHERRELFALPNPWDVGSAKLLASCGFEALATTSAGFAWSLGRLDQTVTRDELVTHVRALAAATPLPLNVDSEGCYPAASGGVAETVRLLAEAGAAGLSIEDYDPVAGAIEPLDVAVARVRDVVAAAHERGEPVVVTARCENHLHGIDDLDDTIARLIAYRDAGADVAYAPGLADPVAIGSLVEAVAIPVNVLAFSGGPSLPELGELGVRRASVGGLLAAAAYGALLAGGRELLATGTAGYTAGRATSAELAAAFGP